MFDIRFIKKNHMIFVVLLLFSFYTFLPLVYAENNVVTNSEMININSNGTLIQAKNDGNLFGPMDSPWPTYSHDNFHTGRSPYNTGDNPMTVKWKFQTERFGFRSSPVIDQNGILYIGCQDGYLYAINPDGSERWRFDCNDWTSDSAALAEDGTIYTGSWDKYLYAINSDGTLKWRFYAHGGIDGSPTIGNDGTVYFGVLGPEGDTGRVYAVNPDCTEKWHTDVGDYVYATPAIAEDNTVYITSNDQYLYALHPENGSIIWKFRTGAGNPTVGNDGTIYVASHDHYLYAMFPNGTLQWKTEIGTGSSDTPAIGNEGTIYIGEFYFYAINPDGTIKWTYKGWEPYQYQVTSPAYAISAEGIIYFVATKHGGWGGDLFALNSDGSLRWRKNIAPDSGQYASPVIGSDGSVYIGSRWTESGKSTGCLYAFGIVENNHPPDKPDIDGPLSGKTRVEYEYEFTVSDVDNDDVYLWVNWGDNTNSGWLGPYENGEEITLTHSWNQQGTYSLQAKAKDEHEVEGEWTTKNVIMPKNKLSNNFSFLQLLEKIMQRFPIFERILLRPFQ
ncbi:MAG: PQQ-binding-like beta-propeller repeat protein [Candidatus Thermoplasmatota archaeon]|nr:PQQ-binding-like beta-propeller repeat protein [Candidatus Thermoplasmatota archaeon]